MKYYEKLKELLESEFSDYSYFKYKIIVDEEYDDFEYYTVKITTEDGNEKELSFRVNSEEIEIDMSEDSWHICRDYDYTIKYFWMALLSWEI